ncbi:Na+-transporting NADH:ubiquinone oxidoreductase, subunit NqrB [bacterium]|nr:Na+-transporting NADH:ubiquinone oxidoreductase, subunit NqrB [bacterium]
MNPVYVGLFIASAVLTQIVFCWITGKSLHSVKSAIITALGLSLLLHVNHAWVAILAAILAISSKFLIKRKGKHIFNPANLGIVATIALSGEAWVSPGQWGSEALFFFLIFSAGLMMIFKVGRLDIAFSFILAFGLLKFGYLVLYLGWEPEVWLHQMANGTLLLFTFFMITDPMTTPNHSKARIIWALVLAIAVFICSIFFYVQTALVWVLFFISIFTPLFDKYFKAEKYEWNISKKLKIETS